MTSKKVLEVFKDYISADSSCKVLHSSRGYLVVDWDSAADRWVTSRLCQTPKQLRDALRSHYEDYQGYMAVHQCRMKVHRWIATGNAMLLYAVRRLQGHVHFRA